MRRFVMKYIEGRIYTCKYSGIKTIFEWTEEGNTYFIMSSKFSRSTWRYWEQGTASDIQEATESEKQWFLACKEANRFIPKNRIKSDYYEIY